MVLKHEPRAVQVTIAADRLIVDLEDGRILSIPLAWYPRLQHGTDDERKNWQLLGDGYAIEWPDLDEHIGVGDCWPASAAGKAASLWIVGWLHEYDFLCIGMTMATMQKTSLLVDEIVDLLASCPSRKELLNYRPSLELKQLALDLLRKSKDGSITQFERWELDQFVFIESLMRLVKARLRSKKENRNHE